MVIHDGRFVIQLVITFRPYNTTHTHTHTNNSGSHDIADQFLKVTVNNNNIILSNPSTYNLYMHDTCIHSWQFLLNKIRKMIKYIYNNVVLHEKSQLK